MEAHAEPNSGLGRRRIPMWLVAAVVVGVAAAGMGLGIAIRLLTRSDAPVAGTTQVTAPASTLVGPATWASGVRPAPPITTLRDQTGHRFSLASLRGRPVAMEFFDSHCHAECPLAGRALAAAERSVPAAERPVLVVVSVNPLDTPASVRAATREWGLAGVAPWHWLMGTHAQLAAIWRAYHIWVQPAKGDINHTEALYLIDRHGYERTGFLYPYAPPFVAHDLRILGAPTRAAGSHA